MNMWRNDLLSEMAGTLFVDLEKQNTPLEFKSRHFYLRIVCLCNCNSTASSSHLICLSFDLYNSLNFKYRSLYT